MKPATCHDLLESLSDYLDGEAPAEICAEIERHMAKCADCRVVVDTLRQTVHLYRGLPQPELPKGTRERLYRSLDLEPFFSCVLILAQPIPKTAKPPNDPV